MKVMTKQERRDFVCDVLSDTWKNYMIWTAHDVDLIVEKWTLDVDNAWREGFEEA